MNNNKAKNNFSGAIGLALFFSLSWGLPSLIRGDGFINGITENIAALISLLVIGLLGYGIFKIFIE
jgi:hypothetical protein